MIKKKIHTLQFIQNKKDIERAKRLLGLPEHSQPTEDELIQAIRERMAELSKDHERTMRKFKLQFWGMILLAAASIVATVYLMVKH